MKRGLVLEGGGAKGAYAFGCLKAFAEGNIKFDAVAGTSVGSLNALLLATDNLKFGETFWSTIRPTRVYRWRMLGVLTVPLALIRAAWYAAIRFTAMKRVSLASAWSAYYKVSFVLLFWIAAGWVIYWITDWAWARSYSQDLWVGILIGGIWLILYTVPFVLDHFGVSLLSPRPLRRQLREVVGSGTSIKMPTYVTVSKDVSLIDPDRPAFVKVREGPPDVYAPAPVDTSIPEYLSLSELSADNRLEAVMATAALPEGVFPPVTLDGVRYRDGGIADNLPIYPLVSIDRCDEIVVIQLRPRSEAVAGPEQSGYEVSYREYWQRIDRLRRLPDLALEKAEMLLQEEHRRYGGIIENHPYAPTSFPFHEPPDNFPKLITLAPRDSLGSFLGATMKFDSCLARNWIDMGHRDATAFILRCWGERGDAVVAQDRDPEPREDAQDETDGDPVTFLSEYDAAKELGVDPVRFRQIVTAGVIPEVVRSGQMVFPAAAVNLFRRRVVRTAILARMIGAAALVGGLFTATPVSGVILGLAGLAMLTTGAMYTQVKGPAACGCLVAGILFIPVYLFFRSVLS